MVVCLYYCYSWDEPERAPHYCDFIAHMFVYENVLLSGYFVHFYFCENSQTSEHTSANLIAALYVDPDAHVWTDTETVSCGLFQTHMTLTISFCG